MNQWEYEQEHPEFSGGKVIYNVQEEASLNDFFEVFSKMEKTDLANEYLAYEKDKNSNPKEKAVLQVVINRIKDSKTNLEKWVKDHKLTKSDIFDLEFSNMLERRGIDPYQGDLAAIKFAIDSSGYKNLWAGKKYDKGPNGTKVRRGYMQDINYLDPDYVRGFTIRRYENAQKIKQRLQKR
jgi:hypothetical protein